MRLTGILSSGCVLAFGALAACADDALPTSSTTPAALDVTVDSVPVGARLHIAVPRPTTVRVKYWSADDSVALEVQRDLSPTDSSIVLSRVLPGTTYSFAAATLSTDGMEGPTTRGSVSVPALPPDVLGLVFQPTGTPTDPVTLFNVIGATGFSGFVAVDFRGKVVWYWRTQGAPQGATRRANGNFVLDDHGFGLREVTPNGELVHQLDWGNVLPHHDVVATSRNTLLFISLDPRSVPGTPGIFGEAIYEWTPESGTVSKRWTSWDWFDPDSDWSSASSPGDWLHGNSLAIGPHGNVLLSLNWLSEIVSIAPDWSHLEWRLGGRNSTFAIDSAAGFSGQHTASEPVEGRVLMFDNGRARADGTQWTRALEVALDTVQHTARMVWEFRPADPIFAPYVGAARRLPNGNTFVFFGLSAGLFNGLEATGPVTGYEVRPDGVVVWRIDLGNVKTAYRGFPLASIDAEHRILRP